MEAHWDEFTLEVERLMSSHSIEDSTSSILDFQANMVRVASRRKNAPLTPERDEVQAVLNMIDACPRWMKRRSKCTAARGSTRS